MNNNKGHGSSLGAAMPQPSGSGFDDCFAAQKDCSAGGEGVSSGKGKKPYKKPSYRYERVFETMALSCGKVGPTEFQCRFNRRNS
jgi:hypothetical protein